MVSDVQKRLRIVQTYKKLGSLRATAEKTGTNVKTVKKWVDRYKQYGQKGLADRRFKVAPKGR
jgi:transposase